LRFFTAKNVNNCKRASLFAESQTVAHSIVPATRKLEVCFCVSLAENDFNCVSNSFPAKHMQDLDKLLKNTAFGEGRSGSDSSEG
jgi:hypothetical protein